jgi:uncharacterized Zn-finger protein
MGEITSVNHQKRDKINVIDVDQDTVVCPPNDGTQWNSHPRVFLDLSSQGEVFCPYCSAHYRLQKITTK